MSPQTKDNKRQMVAWSCLFQLKTGRDLGMEKILSKPLKRQTTQGIGSP